MKMNLNIEYGWVDNWRRKLNYLAKNMYKWSLVHQWNALLSKPVFRDVFVLFFALRHDTRILAEIIPTKLRLFPKLRYLYLIWEFVSSHHRECAIFCTIFFMQKKKRLCDLRIEILYSNRTILCLKCLNTNVLTNLLLIISRLFDT
jgi:hypothetical protein